MAVADGLVTKGHCVIIPKTLRRDILEKLHAAHQGIEKTRLRARTCVSWSGINGDIEEMISKCGMCQEMQHAQRPEPLLQHEVPTRPWQNVGTDLFAIGNRTYLIVSDYYSKFPFVKEVTGAVTSQAVIRLTKEIFSEQGVPATVYSDNGSQYSSSEYRRFSEQWEFNLTTSSPHFPQSNGFIERQIQTVKRTMQKAGAAKIDMAMAMLILRSTPIDSQLPSPAELLYARKLQANVPTKMSDRRANLEDVHERLLQRQLQQKSYHESRGTRSLPELIPDQHVRIRDHVTGSWKPAIVKDVIADEPRSYNVEQPSGGVLRRTDVTSALRASTIKSTTEMTVAPARGQTKPGETCRTTTRMPNVTRRPQ